MTTEDTDDATSGGTDAGSSGDDSRSGGRDSKSSGDDSRSGGRDSISSGDDPEQATDRKDTDPTDATVDTAAERTDTDGDSDPGDASAVDRNGEATAPASDHPIPVAGTTAADSVTSAIGDLGRDVRAGTVGALAGTLVLVAVDAALSAGALAGLAELLGAGSDAGVGAVVFFATGALAWSALFSVLRPYLPGGRTVVALGLAGVLWIGVVAGLALEAAGTVESLPVAAVGVLLAFGAYGFLLGEADDLVGGRRSTAGE